jgi:lipopolysaccharide biosynthesis glycosyltransferase
MNHMQPLLVDNTTDDEPVVASTATTAINGGDPTHLVERSDGMLQDNPPVLDAKVVALFPPRPDAILTFLHSDDFFPGTQTLLYSLKRTLNLSERMYPPEIVVMVPKNENATSADSNNKNGKSSSPRVDLTQCQRLVDTGLCTRILEVDDWPAPTRTINSKIPTGMNNNNNNNGKASSSMMRRLDDHCPGWTKLQIFGLQQYDAILYIDSDCLVLKDVAHLLDLNKIYVESEALIAAAPDVFPPDRFNSGVMVIRPSRQVHKSMQDHATILTTGDHSDTGFLNAFFPTWYNEYPPFGRLSSGYNAPQVWHDWTRLDNDNDDDDDTPTTTKRGTSMFWDVQIAPNLHIVHYSNPIKPWQQNDFSKQQQPEQSSLIVLFNTWYKKSRNYMSRMERDARQQQQNAEQQEEKDQVKMRRRNTQKSRASASTEGASHETRRQPQLHNHNHPRVIHRLIQRRFKELRSQGMSTKGAMQQARNELQPASERDDSNMDVGAQVAAMFGMS